MNILFVNKYLFSKGGAEVSMFVSANALKERGHSVSFFGMEHQSNQVKSISSLPFIDFDSNMTFKQKLEYIGRTMYYFRAKRQMESVLAENSFDVVHLNNIAHQISPSVISAAKKRHIPVVMSVRDYKVVCPSYMLRTNDATCNRCKNGSFYNAVVHKCHKSSRSASAIVAAEAYLHRLLRLYNGVDRFLTTSCYVKNVLEDMGLDADIEVLPNAVGTSTFKNNTTINNGKDVVVYFGRLGKEKGVATLIAAMKDIDAELWIIGDGPELTVLRQLSQSARVSTKFFGYKEGQELIRLVGQGKVVVVPSEWEEPFGRTVIEAFQLGLPVIGARIGGVKELIKDGFTGLLFESGSVQDLRRAIRMMLSNEEQRIVMGENAAAESMKYRPDIHACQLEDIYKSLLK